MMSLIDGGLAGCLALETGDEVDLVGITFLTDTSYARSGGGRDEKEKTIFNGTMSAVCHPNIRTGRVVFGCLWRGVNYPGCASVTAEITSYGLLMATTTESHAEKVHLDSSLTMGGRLGYWFEKLPWLGVALDLSYFKADGEKAEFDAVPLSLLLMLRWPLFINRLIIVTPLFGKIPSLLPLPKGGKIPLFGKEGGRGDFVKDVYSILRLLIRARPPHGSLLR